MKIQLQFSCSNLQFQVFRPEILYKRGIMGTKYEKRSNSHDILHFTTTLKFHISRHAQPDISVQCVTLSTWRVLMFLLTLRSMIKMSDTMAIVANVKVKFRINSSDMISLASHWMYMYEYAIGESKRLALLLAEES